MKVVTPGHCYELEHFENRECSQEIQFIQKEFEGAALRTVRDGTTNEEVLRMLIDRLKFLGAKLPSRENSIALTKLEEALMWLEKRTADRVQRAVEGTHQP